MKVALISLEPWDDVWRRNQHLAAELIRLGLVDHLWFVEPARRGRRSMSTREVGPGVTVIAPSTPLPKSLGGLRLLGRRVRRRLLHDVDLLWVNDPALGVHCMRRDLATVYDVTDDWRTARFPRRILRRIIAAEDRLARSARTVVCSAVLLQRWFERYGIRAPIVHNGIDARLWQSATARTVQGQPPHVGYVGTLHEQRLDIDLVADLARAEGVGTLHLIGPNCLPDRETRRLERLRTVQLHGAVPAAEVPSWMLAMDVLISPHRVNPFTLSLDAIKAYEYSAAGRPVVATATSGFAPGKGTTVATREDFVDACLRACQQVAPSTENARPAGRSTLAHLSWEARARQFWDLVQTAPSAADKEKTHA